MKIGWLESNWCNLLQKSQADSKLGEIVFADLIDTYSHPTRHYHNLGHIQALLTLFEAYKDIRDRLVSLQLSAWFHDYIYNPQAKNNEIKSAVYAEKILDRLKISPDIINLVKQIILSTAKHEPLVEDVANSIFLDADLSILGTSPDNYRKYAQAIRKEYNWLSEQDYRQGRKQVLANFLSRERIYYTDYFYERLERQARANLKAEIKFCNNNY